MILPSAEMSTNDPKEFGGSPGASLDPTMVHCPLPSSYEYTSTNPNIPKSGMKLDPPPTTVLPSSDKARDTPRPLEPNSVPRNSHDPRDCENSYTRSGTAMFEDTPTTIWPSPLRLKPFPERPIPVMLPMLDQDVPDPEYSNIDTSRVPMSETARIVPSLLSRTFEPKPEPPDKVPIDDHNRPSYLYISTLWSSADPNPMMDPSKDIDNELSVLDTGVSNVSPT